MNTENKSSNPYRNDLEYYCSVISTFQLVEASYGLHRSQRKSYQKLIEMEYALRKNIFSTFISTGSLVITGIGIILALLRVSKYVFVSIIAFLALTFVIIGIYLSIQNLRLREEERKEKASNAYFRLVDDLWEYETEYYLLENIRKRLELAGKENIVTEGLFNEKLPRINELIKSKLEKTLNRIEKIIGSIEEMEKNPRKYGNVLKGVNKDSYEIRREELQKNLEKIEKGGN